MALPNGEFYAAYMCFQNGEKWQGYSRDFARSRDRMKKKRNVSIGLKRFFKMFSRHEFNLKFIIIYDHRPGNPTNGSKIYHWDSQNGVLIDKTASILAHGKSVSNT